MPKKRRRRTSKDVPAKGRLRDMADRLWSIAVRADWAGKCAVCNAGKIEAHHLIPRQHEATRYRLQNGIGLCSSHHQFDKDVSPHQNAAGWMQWLGAHYPVLADWCRHNCRPEFSGRVTPSYLIEQIEALREYVEPDEFEAIVGVKFNRYLEEQQ